MAITGDQIVAHAWIAYHDGKGWREADPTSGAMSVGAGHVEASLLDLVGLLSIGGLKVVSAEPQ